MPALSVIAFGLLLVAYEVLEVVNTSHQQWDDMTVLPDTIWAVNGIFGSIALLFALAVVVVGAIHTSRLVRGTVISVAVAAWLLWNLVWSVATGS